MGKELTVEYGRNKVTFKQDEDRTYIPITDEGKALNNMVILFNYLFGDVLHVTYNPYERTISLHVNDNLPALYEIDVIEVYRVSRFTAKGLLHTMNKISSKLNKFKTKSIDLSKYQPEIEYLRFPVVSKYVDNKILGHITLRSNEIIAQVDDRQSVFKLDCTYGELLHNINKEFYDEADEEYGEYFSKFLEQKVDFRNIPSMKYMLNRINDGIRSEYNDFREYEIDRTIYYDTPVFKFPFSIYNDLIGGEHTISSICKEMLSDYTELTDKIDWDFKDSRLHTSSINLCLLVTIVSEIHGFILLNHELLIGLTINKKDREVLLGKAKEVENIINGVETLFIKKLNKKEK